MSPDNMLFILSGILLLMIGLSISALTVFDFGSIQSDFPIIDLSILSLASLVLGALYFGRFSGLALFFAGITLGKPFLNNPTGIGVEFIVIFFAAYIGHLIGRASSSDLDGEGNMFENKKRILAYTVLLVVLIIIAGAAIPFIPKTPINFG